MTGPKRTGLRKPSPVNGAQAANLNTVYPMFPGLVSVGQTVIFLVVAGGPGGGFICLFSSAPRGWGRKEVGHPGFRFAPPMGYDPAPLRG